MARSKPSDKRTKKRRKSGEKSSQGLSVDQAPALLERATTLLHQGEPEEALKPANKALRCLTINSAPLLAPLPALEIIGEIYVDLGDIDQARDVFMKAAMLDPNGAVPEAQGGGADKFLWLAQLSEEGGEDSVRWYEKGINSLRRELAETDGQVVDVDQIRPIEIRKSKLSDALCSIAEVYMTDLSWDQEAETKCEKLAMEACLVSPNSPDALQTLASVRISQQKLYDARSALERSIELWQDLEPGNAKIPEYSTRISLSRLLMEVDMAEPAVKVLDRLVKEDDTSVEAWYLGGWCFYLMAEEELEKTQEPRTHESKAHIDVSREFSRTWLLRSLKLYDMVGYEDERLQAHAQELVMDLTLKLGTDPEPDDFEPFALQEWEDEDEDEDDENASEEVESVEMNGPL